MNDALKDQYTTYEEFLKLNDQISNGKIEYNNGVVVYMSPTSRRHNTIVYNIRAKLTNFLKATKCQVYSEQVAVIFENESEKREFQPDVFVVCEDAKLRGEKFITPPKIVFEVVSRSNASYDYYVKTQVYEKFGVLEYNIVQEDNSIVQYVLEDGMYIIKNTIHIGEYYKSSLFEELSFKVDELF
jgi:Uma2 family endonuclease